MKSFVMLLVGAGIGTALGMMFAPRTGEEMRNNLADAVNQGKQKTQEWTQRAGQQARKIASDVRDQVSDAAQEGTRQYREAKGS